ncbi:MAG: glutaredoxin domain-containing protein [Armatimonadia bacterium]
MRSTKSGEITLFGKKNCGLCTAAKDKLRLMGLPFEFVDIGPLVEHHDGWRNDGSVEALAASTMFEGHLPIFKIAGRFYSYPEAMRLLKGQLQTERPRTSAAPLAAPVREQELAPAFAM